MESRIEQAGGGLLESFGEVLDRVPESTAGPQRLSGALGIDKVLASRLLKTMRSPDAMTAAYRAPGPDPMRRVLLAAGKAGVDPKIIETARAAVDAYERLIKVEVGDRSALDAILSAWVPEAREEFETRRKQAAFRAMSQLKGIEASVYSLTNIFVPNEDGVSTNSVVITALLGLRRLRPGVPIYHSSGIPNNRDPNRPTPTNLQGDTIDSLTGILLPDFSSRPLPTISVRSAGKINYFKLESEGVGLASAVDMVTCEVIPKTRERYRSPGWEKRYWSALLMNIPARSSQYDVYIHKDIFEPGTVDMRVYDTMTRGFANWNDPSRDIDRLDFLVHLEKIGQHGRRFVSPVVPRYHDILSHVFRCLGVDASQYEGYRVADEFPLHGSQFTLSYQRPVQPADELTTESA